MFRKLGVTKGQRDRILELGGYTMFTLQFITEEILGAIGLKPLQIKGFFKCVSDSQS